MIISIDEPAGDDEVDAVTEQIAEELWEIDRRRRDYARGAIDGGRVRT